MLKAKPHKFRRSSHGELIVASQAAAATPAATPAAPAVEEAMFQEYLKLCKSSKYVQKNNASGWHVKLKMAVSMDFRLFLFPNRTCKHMLTGHLSI